MKHIKRCVTKLKVRYLFRVPASWGSTFRLGVTVRKAVKSFPIDFHRVPCCISVVPAGDFPKGAGAFCQMLLNLQGPLRAVKECAYWNHTGALPPWKMPPTATEYQQEHRSDHLSGEGYSNTARLLSQTARLTQLDWKKIQISAELSQVC